MDLFGLSAVQSYGGNFYTLVLVDDYSRYTWTRFLQHKNEALDQFEILSKKIQVQKGCPVISIHTDHGREFDNEVQFRAFCDANDYLTKFDPKSTEGIFLGYSPNSKAYIVLNKETMRIEESLNVKFDESPHQPKNVKEAIKDKSWTMAMQEELNQFKTNDVWSLVLPPNKQTIIGYNQQEGIDFDETYAPVARLESIRILLAYACAHDFKLYQMDVKCAFLNDFINEELYVAQPAGFIDLEKPNHVFKLKKALYGLKQSPTACLLYLMASRPDIMFSVCLCIHFQEAPKTSHSEAVKRIFRYIKGNSHLGLWYPKGTGVETIVYADFNHARDYIDHKSTSGVCTFMGCCLTSWFSKKQTTLAISTTEAEYVSAGKACQQALWMKQDLLDYDINLDDIPVLYDNKGAIDLSKNHVLHSRTKHIEIRHHFLRDNVKKGNISIEKVSSEDNITDILTKPLKR
nr:copia protein [Tanacetum cinerariifolium]